MDTLIEELDESDPVAPAAPVDGPCAARSVSAEQVVVEEESTIEEEIVTRAPVAMYIMQDQSFSMLPLWPAATTSIQQFVNDPASAGVEVAIGYFPVLLGGDCATGTPFNVPEVPLGALPGHAQAVTDSLGMHAPFGLGTPTEGALRGMTSFCEDYLASHPDTQCVGVLISDGAPSDGAGCAADTPTLAAIAAQSNQRGVVTYTVGLFGADFNLLDAIAEAGGGDCDPNRPSWACNVSAGAEELVEALSRIRDEVTTVVTRVETITKIEETPLDCEWVIPAPVSGGRLDFDKVNVALTSPVAASPEFGRVDSAEVCQANGWYYDDPEAPTRIIACPETCGTVQSTEQATIEVLLDCKTVVIRPPK